MRWRESIVVLVAALASGGPALAERPSAPLRLEVEEGAAPQQLLVALVNTAEVPVTVYVDRRLATLELREERRSLGQCRLPADAVPREPDERRFVTLQPGERAAEALDLRFFCFGLRAEALERARAVRVSYQGRFGFDQLGNPSWTGRLGPVEASLGALPAEGPLRPAEASAVVGLARLGARPDVATGDDLSLSVELRGPARGRLVAAVRPELFSFQVSTPRGRTLQCQLPLTRVRPIRDFYGLLRRQQASFELATLCPPSSLAEPGIYRVTPRFDAIFDGRDVGVTAWTGAVVGEEFLVRVRRAGAEAADPVEIMLPERAVERGQDAR